ncbi:hypothetical protein KVR01_001903 [Diaporthe batatas]|uniref:uncharacterized protein n=1 Tax=Diaporthe batatas TaxID=748121 RepID=UPI001D039242|nr:uncharacterized protein KVR01_001903 [Diaporthe batatas]KAG8169154.1 hypothetical protein KVR01_001903 [Diaporthe batatas]
MAPFNLAGLPLELRQDIYELVVFDLSPPEKITTRGVTTAFTYRHMHTNILLVSRKIFWEVRNMIVSRGRLVMVSATHLPTHLPNESFQGVPVHVEMLTDYPRIRVIHPKYRNLCIMNHHINAARSAVMPEPNEDTAQWDFILHQHEIEVFCHTLMGKFSARAECVLGPRSKHNLVLHCLSSYAQHESLAVSEMQTRLLQQYRGILRGFEDVSIRGTSTGWESGLYSATLRDIRSADSRRERPLAEFLGVDLARLLEYFKKKWTIL